MALYDRWVGAELSVVEREMLFNDAYADTGFVIHYSNDGKLFQLLASPFLENKDPATIYFAESCSPPPEHIFAEVDVVSEKEIWNEKTGANNSIKTIDSWKPFDPTPLAAQRRILDHEEVVQHFTHLIRGEEDIIHQIATCSALYALSSPPGVTGTGGITTAVFGKKFQWDLFTDSLAVIPDEFRAIHSPYYYFISAREKKRQGDGSEEISLAILKPKKTIADIPLEIGETDERTFLRGYRKTLQEENAIVTAYMLDSLLLKPEPSARAEQIITDAIYELRDDVKKGGRAPYNQNLGDAIPKLSASLARLHHNSEVEDTLVKQSVGLLLDMHHRVIKIHGTPLKISEAYRLSGDARKLYFTLYETFGADYWIPSEDALAVVRLDPAEFETSIDSLCREGYCQRKTGFVKILEEYA
ncbi:MAG: hypothetical protein JXA08_07740 [Methanomicrobiaceae archaeon]|nr:hypothetical protein [Methanomicrobiaceae archaeon]